MGLDIKKKSKLILECINKIHIPSVGLSPIYMKNPSMLLWFEGKFGVWSDEKS